MRYFEIAIARADRHHEDTKLRCGKQELKPDHAVRDKETDNIALPETQHIQVPGSSLARCQKFSARHGSIVNFVDFGIRRPAQPLLHRRQWGPISINHKTTQSERAVRAIWMRCISEVPSPIRKPRASR